MFHILPELVTYFWKTQKVSTSNEQTRYLFSSLRMSGKFESLTRKKSLILANSNLVMKESLITTKFIFFNLTL